ncbi:uncharacterized protein [Rutidosis leptorrhynchoides]|uniref:uncharacterized protein n=1 Tax=Rutidosis leptorrhynchoides TaxID=125765 RepID=UPI003A994AA4
MEINGFTQRGDETLYDASVQFKKMLRACPPHGLTKKEYINTFYWGTNALTKQYLDSSSGGAFMYKSPNAAETLLEDISVNTYEWAPSPRDLIRKIVAQVESDNGQVTLASLNNQFQMYGKELKKLQQSIVAMQVGCQRCEGPHLTKNCPQISQCNHIDLDDIPMNSDAHVNYVSNQNYQWGGTSNQGYYNPNQKQVSFNNQTITPPEFTNQNQSRNQKNKFNLDKALESDTMDLGVFKFLNDSEDAKFIPYQVKSVMSMEATESTYKELEGDFERIKLVKVEKELKFEHVLNIKEQKNEVEVLATTTKEKNETPVSHLQPLPLPHLKDVDYTHGQKGDVEQASTAFLKKECDGILKKCNLPPKMSDPGPFLIPYNVNGSEMLTSLVDSRAIINFMPYSIYNRLGLGDLSPTTMGVKLINQSFSSSVGIVEDLIFKVGDIEFPIDFFIVEIKEDPVVPLILGRPFLATAGSSLTLEPGN